MFKVSSPIKMVTLEEIPTHDYNLSIPCYIEPQIKQEVLSVERAVQRLKKSAIAAFTAEEKLIALMLGEGLLS